MGGLDAALGANAVATSADARFASGTRWGSLIADIMIALGVGGEVFSVQSIQGVNLNYVGVQTRDSETR
jgi:hypothetical protein